MSKMDDRERLRGSESEDAAFLSAGSAGLGGKGGGAAGSSGGGPWRVDPDDPGPEGEPAFPRLRGWGTAAVTLVALGVVIAVSVVGGRTLGAMAGAAIFVVGVIVTLLLNPVMWAAVLRARERSGRGQVGDPSYREGGGRRTARRAVPPRK